MTLFASRNASYSLKKDAKKNETGRRVESMGLGAMDTMLGKRNFSADPVDVISMRAFIDECSRKALDVSLQSEDLSNLHRGRLLDILLWAGELFLLLRAPRLALAESIDSSEGQLAPRASSQSL